MSRRLEDLFQSLITARFEVSYDWVSAREAGAGGGLPVTFPICAAH
jgi:hypothetical protein